MAFAFLIVALELVCSVMGQPPKPNPCSDGSEPTCPDGSEPDKSTKPPSCPSGEPLCSDGSKPKGPGGDGQGPGGGGPGGGGPGGGGPGGGGPGGGGPGGGGQLCSETGNIHSLNLAYDGTTGQFAGSIITNLCPTTVNPERDRGPTASCTQQTIPDPGLSSSPGPVPLLGRVALTLMGINIYSGYEAGFGTSTSSMPPFPCQDLDQDMDQDGYCQGGLDVKTCEDGLHYACGADAVETAWFLDECGGHATPYHLHHHPSCEYNQQATGHSPLVAIALDGYGMYGLWEDGEGKAPTLDACNGHTGPVPVDPSHGVDAGTVYHYHFSADRPFTLGCFGPVDSLNACKSLYSTCNDDFVKVPSDANGAFLIYDLFCPCYRHGDEIYVDFSAAAAALEMTATHVAVQGVNDGTVESRSLPSAGGSVGNMHQMGAKGSGSSSSDQCTSSTTSVDAAWCARTTPLLSFVLAGAATCVSW